MQKHVQVKCILLGEGNLSEKSPFIWHSGKGKAVETANRSVVAWHLGKGKGERGKVE